MTAPRAEAPTTFEGRLRSRPVLGAIALQVVFYAIVIGGTILLAVAFPQLPGYSVTGPSAAFLVEIALFAFVLLLIGALRWWRPAGFTRPGEWRDLRLYWLPVVLVFVPFVAGIKVPGATALVYLPLGYLMTGVIEEGLYRGVFLVLLRPLGVWPAVLLSSLFFGLAHLDNVALRGFSAMILLQAFGSAVQGIGYAALRLRTSTIWPLVLIHAAHDLTLQMGDLPIPLVEAGTDTILLVYGIVLLRSSRRTDVQLSPEIPLAGARFTAVH